jgi:DNA (cytosine-5)-methyltransferase 1
LLGKFNSIVIDLSFPIFSPPSEADVRKKGYEKFKAHNTDRYYLLTTASMDNADWNGINAEIRRILQIHGCQVVVNGVYATLKYYLRLLDDPAEFTSRYVECMKADETIKFQHKTMWNDIVGGK